MKKFIYLLFFVTALNLWTKDKEKDKKWDVSNPPGKFKEVTLNLNEGTWMNLDISPDGKQIVFDILGDIYIMPIEGGDAKVLRSGLAWEVQPRFSPDGKKISFTSDAGGGDNIWMMNSDGSNPKAITNEDFRLLNNAVWTPDGQYLIARKHFTNTRSIGAGELWMYHFTGGQGLQLTKRKNDQQDVNEPTVSPDGRYVYFSEDVYPGGYFQYNKDPNQQIYIIKKYDRTNGEIENVISGPGGACRPQISPDGKSIAYIKRVHARTVLYINNLKTGEQRPIFDKLSKDQQEAWAVFGTYPGFSWMPDGKSIVIWGQGKLWKIDIESLIYTEIPFKLKSNQRLYDQVRYKHQVFSETFESKVIRNAITSPDEKFIVFNAIGHIWKKVLPNGIPERITNETDFEFEPSFSKNGNELIYVTWNDEEMGSISKVNLTIPGSKPQKIKSDKGIFRSPSFSPDGSKIIYWKEEGNNHQGFNNSNNPGIYLILTSGGEPVLIRKDGEYPIFNSKGDRIFFQTGGYLFADFNKSYSSCDLSGNKELVHFTSKYTNKFVPSPDNKWILFNELFNAYIAPFPETGKVIDLNGKTTDIPVAKITRDAGINLHWSNDSKKVFWTLGDEYFSNNLSDRFAFIDGNTNELPPIDTVGLKINLKIKTDAPQGKIAFTNARIITMNGEEVIENGTIIIENNKIKSIGKSNDIKVTPDYKVIDVTGKTILPGFIDVHSHLGTFRYGLSPQKQWSYYANLAYGVTTTHDPSSNTEMVFSQSEMVKAGTMIGPRVYSTGIILYGADGDFKAVVNSLEDAKSALRRTQAFGAFSVKSYNQPRRDQRQMIIEAARELNMMVFPEGGSFFNHNMTQIIDGHSSVEHNMPIAPLQADVTQLWGLAKGYNTPTLIVNYGGLNGENYWYQNTNVWENSKLLNFTPRAIIDSRSRHRTMAPDEEYENGHILVSKSCKKLTDAGAKITLGSHGQLQGLGAHWEIWMFTQGGMTNMEALRAATMNGAQYLGMESEIGSLESGKLADLIIMDKNPLENIRNTESIKFVMINGRLYDSFTMNEIGNNDKPRGKFYWELDGYNQNFPWHENTNSFEDHKCFCGE